MTPTKPQHLLEAAERLSAQGADVSFKFRTTPSEDAKGSTTGASQSISGGETAASIETGTPGVNLGEGYSTTQTRDRAEGSALGFDPSSGPATIGFIVAAVVAAVAAGVLFKVRMRLEAAIVGVLALVLFASAVFHSLILWLAIAGVVGLLTLAVVSVVRAKRAKDEAEVRFEGELMASEMADRAKKTVRKIVGVLDSMGEGQDTRAKEVKKQIDIATKNDDDVRAEIREAKGGRA
jgi:hypothetical protein